MSGWNRLADAQGFIVVYPSGSGVPRTWHADRGPELMREVDFIRKLIDTLAADYNVTGACAPWLSSGLSFVVCGRYGPVMGHAVVGATKIAKRPVAHSCAVLYRQVFLHCVVVRAPESAGNL